MLEKIKEQLAKYLAESILGLAGLVAMAIAAYADQLFPTAAIESLGRVATGKIVLGMALVIALLFAWIIYLHPRLRFDERTGTLMAKGATTRYCHVCKIDRKGRIPLLTQENGWLCRICGHFFVNPDWKPKPDPRPMDVMGNRY